MKANEIVSGDYVHCITDNKLQQVWKVNEGDTNLLCDDGLYRDVNDKINFLYDIDGVPLKEEYFVNNGFEVYHNGATITYWRQRDNEDQTELYDIDIDTEENDEYFYVRIRSFKEDGAQIIKKIRYVHELQHLFLISGLYDEINFTISL